MKKLILSLIAITLLLFFVSFTADKSVNQDSIKIEFLDVLPEQFNHARILHNIYHEHDAGYETLFSMEDYRLVDVLDILNGRTSFRTNKRFRGIPSNTTELSFLDESSLEKDTPFNFIYIKEDRVNQFKHFSRDEFLLSATKKLEKHFNLKEKRIEVQQYRLLIEQNNQFRLENSTKKSQAEIIHKSDRVVLKNINEKDLADYLSNRYLKKIDISYEECFHSLLLGHFIFDKIEINKMLSFVEVCQLLEEQYSIILSKDIGDYIGLVYHSNNSKIELENVFGGYETMRHKDDYIELTLELVSGKRKLSGKSNDTNGEDIYLSMNTFEGLFDRLHAGIKTTGKGSYSFKKRKNRQEVFFDINPNPTRTILEAKNLQPEVIDEEEFRFRVENVILEKYNIEKKTIDYPLYKYTIDLDKVMQSENCVAYKNGEKEARITFTGSWINKESYNFNMTINPGKFRSSPPTLLGYDVIFEKPETKGLYRRVPINTNSEEDTIYNLENIVLPQNDLVNAICILKENGVLIEKTENTERVLIYRNK